MLLHKVAVVTGGAKGIGLACARSLAREGAKVRAGQEKKRQELTMAVGACDPCCTIPCHTSAT